MATAHTGAGVGVRHEADGRRVAAAALALFLVTGALYLPLTVPAGYNTTDPLLIVPSALSLLRDGDLDLSEYGDAIDPRFHGVLLLDGRPYNRYPVGASLLVLPMVWAADRLLPPHQTAMARALAIAAVAAKVVAAASVALLFVVLAELTGLATALGLALVFGFATPHLPIHAGGLFTHNAVIPVLLIALLLLVRRDGRHAAMAGPVLAFAFVTRPTCAPVVALLSLYVVRHLPDARRRFAAFGGAAGVAFVGWSLWMYAAPLPPYYWSYDATSPYAMSLGRFAEGLVGHLVSPNRGVFVFAPIVAFSVWGMAAARRSEARHAALFRTLALAVIAHWLVISVMARKWWAGWSFGPRHVVETFPLMILLLVPALDAMRAAPRPVRVTLAPLGAAALAWSLFAAVHGARSPEPSAWSAIPRSVDAHPERVWDWRDMQILRGAGW
jgi:hypothetical protein